MNMAAIDLTSIVQAVISLLAVIISTQLIPWLKAKTTAEQQQTGMMLVRTLVYAAEQIYGSKTGTEKLAYVQKQLMEHGYRLDMAQIEAAVRKMSMESMLITESTISHDETE